MGENILNGPDISNNNYNELNTETSAEDTENEDDQIEVVYDEPSDQKPSTCDESNDEDQGLLDDQGSDDQIDHDQTGNDQDSGSVENLQPTPNDDNEPDTETPVSPVENTENEDQKTDDSKPEKVESPVTPVSPHPFAFGKTEDRKSSRNVLGGKSGSKSPSKKAEDKKRGRAKTPRAPRTPRSKGKSKDPASPRSRPSSKSRSKHNIVGKLDGQEKHQWLFTKVTHIHGDELVEFGGDGETISKKQFVKYWKEHIDLEPKVAKKWWKELDARGKGRIDEKEFDKWKKKHAKPSALEHLFK